MNLLSLLLFSISFFLIINPSYSIELEVRTSLFSFLAKLSNDGNQPDPSLGWDINSDPCNYTWKGISCDRKNITVTKILLDNFNLSGVLDVSSLCNIQSIAESLSAFSLNGNNVSGEISVDIVKCKQIMRLHLTKNKLSGDLPNSLPMLSNLKILEISYNKFTGSLAGLDRISGLNTLLVEYNQLDGNLPQFDFSNFQEFNVSYNNLSGQTPDKISPFNETSFVGNPELCGDPLPNKCPPPQVLDEKSKGSSSKNQVLMYLGYALLGLVILFAILWKLTRRKKVEPEKKVASADDSFKKQQISKQDSYKAEVSKSEVSVVSADNSTMVSTSLVVLTSPVKMNGLKFETLLQARAELLGRGEHGSLYKVMLDKSVMLAVKRIKDWEITSDEFKKRMLKIDQARHPNVLPAIAFYTSKHEKLLVYEYQQNGCLFKLLQGTNSEEFDWASRLNVAARVAETLAYMHQSLRKEGIAHGNLKSSNILLNINMEPCLSEYGLIPMEYDQNFSSLPTFKQTKSNAFDLDIYGFGMILLELLTGKLVEHNGVELTKWVNSVVREEWTVEVFDKYLISVGASTERMVNLLQVALKCISEDSRPSINQVVAMINGIKEDEERSVTSIVLEV
ncbi:hypothetical protein ACFE04_008978 [Oxalis oulophora]